MKKSKGKKITWNEQVKKRTGKEWLKLIQEIPDQDIRIQTACIVWWDYSERFEDGINKKQFTELDHFPCQWNVNIKQDWQAVREALINIGYPKDLAQKRTERK